MVSYLVERLDRSCRTLVVVVHHILAAASAVGPSQVKEERLRNHPSSEVLDDGSVPAAMSSWHWSMGTDCMDQVLAHTDQDLVEVVVAVADAADNGSCCQM